MSVPLAGVLMVPCHRMRRRRPSFTGTLALMRELIINGDYLFIQCDHPQVVGDVVVVLQEGLEQRVRITSVASFGDTSQYQYNVEAV